MNEIKPAPFACEKIVEHSEKIPEGIQLMRVPVLWEERRQGKEAVVAVLKVLGSSGSAGYETLSSAISYALDWQGPEGQKVGIVLLSRDEAAGGSVFPGKAAGGWFGLILFTLFMALLLMTG